MRRLRSLATLLVLPLLGACAVWDDGPAYWWQSAAGQLEVIRKARPVVDLIDDPATAPDLRERLKLAQEIRAFASRELDLPDNDSYSRYADLGRPYVVWNVFAAPPLSLRLRQWCFPVAGCIAYRGFFDQADAERFAQRMRAEGYEAHVAGITAYSTLGWFSDPLLNTFALRSETELARLVFHELAHQKLYLKGDTTFNESYATAIERIGVERWLDSREAQGADPAQRAAWRAQSARRADFLALLSRHREALRVLFAQDLSDAQKLEQRNRIFDQMRSDYSRLRERWGGFAGYDAWFAQPLSTPRLAAVATYTDLVPAFDALLARHGGDIVRFHQAAAELARLPTDERRAAIEELHPGQRAGR
jgi:predicted aminopeptidase